MNAQLKKIAPSVEDALSELDCYEAWRPALAAFYRADGSFQSAWNVERGFPLTISDTRMIDCLQRAFEKVAA